MSDLVQEIDPLEISFSNEKGFEPSTPSQGSPPASKDYQDFTPKIRTPIELFHQKTEVNNKENLIIYPKVETPKTRNAPNLTQFLSQSKTLARYDSVRHYQTRYSSSRKPYREILSGDYWSRGSTMHGSEMIESRPREGRRQAVQKWEEMGATNHLKEISRLNELINKVNTHIGLYNRKYPLGRK